MSDVKAELKSCASTGLIGLSFFASLVSGVYHLSKEAKKEVAPNKPVEKIMSKRVLAKKANYWTQAKDR